MKAPLLLLATVVAGSAIAQTAILTQGAGIAQRRLAMDEQHQYHVQLPKGGHATFTVQQLGVDVTVEIQDPAGNKVGSFDSPNGANGPELVHIDAPRAGTYTVTIFPTTAGVPANMLDEYKKENQGDYRIDAVQISNAAEYRRQLAEEQRRRREFIDWMGTQAHPLSTVQAGNPTADLQWLKPVLQNTQYVALGEATHGTREFFQLKHRMLEFLVKEMGFTVFAIEASYAGCRNINDYVLRGKGDAHTALASQGFWTWDTEEVIDLIEWMRAYNQTVPDERKVQFYGFDIQVNEKGGGIARLRQYLQQADSAYARSQAPVLDRIAAVERQPSGEEATRAFAPMKDLLLTLVLREEHFRRTAPEGYDEALQAARLLAQLGDAYLMAKNDPRRAEREWRDYYMADNFFRFVRRNPAAKVMLWAHNAHVSKDETAIVNTGIHPFGAYLRAAFGERYYSMGFAFNQGSFQAVESDKGLQEFTLPPAREASLDSFLAAVPQAMYVLNLRTALPPAIADRFHAGLDTRNFGSMANREWAATSYDPIDPLRAYDALIFINRTTRARSTPTGRR